jgi:hypothetical protein
MSVTRKRTSKKSVPANSFIGRPGISCDGGQCVRSVNTPTSTSSTLTLTLQSETVTSPADESYLASILPRDYYDAMLEAAKYGFLYAFVASTPVEFFNQHYKNRQMSPQQIYYANQIIRATAYLGLSVYLGFMDMKSLLIALGAPVTSALLKYHGSSDVVAQLAPAGMAATFQIAADFSHCGKAMLTLMAGLGGTLIGNSAAKRAYSWASAGLFHLNQYIQEALENISEETLRQAV